MGRVLICDDSQLVQSMFVKYLELHGVEAVGASNGRQALDIIEQGDVSILVTDQRMPVMTGIELIDELKERGLTLEHIILMSTYCDLPISEIMAKGVDKIMNKPIDLEEFYDQIKPHLVG